jgi:signal transduction histidine kinase
MQDKYQEVMAVVVAGSVIFLVITGIVVFILLFYQKKRFQHRQQYLKLESSIQQELLKAQLESQEATFRQVGDELHDNVGQLLSSTKILLAITERSLPEVPDTLHTASETLAKAIKDLRALSKSLNREWLEKFNLIDNLRMEADRINMARMVHVDVAAAVPALSLRPESQVMLFRIIQEAMQNAIKHAEAAAITVTIATRAQHIDVWIKDNGGGLPGIETRPHGVGLLNMEHRTRLLGGDIRWESAPGRGTQVSISLPTQTLDI